MLFYIHLFIMAVTARSRFEGKVCLVTGGTSGIGKEVSLALAKEGCKVLFTGRREKLGAEVEQFIQSEGGEATYIKADVTIEEDNKRMVEIAVEKYGRLDVAFNNAGITETENIWLHEYDTDRWKRFIDVNLNGVFFGLKYELAQMSKQETGGTILNNNSIFGLTVHPSNWGLAYQTTKHALTGLMKSAAMQYSQKNIRVNDINPGAVDTAGMLLDMAGGIFQDVMGEAHPMGRVVKMKGVVGTALFALSDDSTDVSGMSLEVSGGLTKTYMPQTVNRNYMEPLIMEAVVAASSRGEAEANPGSKSEL